jgi:L-galactono-1,4-lactone dehydrogenase
MYSWVGIIMYLPEVLTSSSGLVDRLELSHSKTANVTGPRADITGLFKQYRRACEENLWHRVGAVEHWAKLEPPEDDVELARLRHRISQKYPVIAFNAIRELFDPKNILSNDLTDAVFGRSTLLKDSAECHAETVNGPQILPTAAGA